MRTCSQQGESVTIGEVSTFFRWVWLRVGDSLTAVGSLHRWYLRLHADASFQKQGLQNSFHCCVNRETENRLVGDVENYVQLVIGAPGNDFADSVSASGYDAMEQSDVYIQNRQITALEYRAVAHRRFLEWFT